MNRPRLTLGAVTIGLILLVNTACEKSAEAPPDGAKNENTVAAVEFAGIHEPSGDRVYILKEKMDLFRFREKCMKELCKIRIGLWYDESGYWICRCQGEGKRYMVKYTEIPGED